MNDAAVDTDAAAIRLAVLDAYAALPATGKPQAGEWSVLAGIALRSASDALEVVALGTGTKCLTAKAIAAERSGGCLHDGHAEVCARRAFLRYLLAQLRLHAGGDAARSVLEPRPGGGYALKAGYSVHFYSSQPPCGDAAIFGTGSGRGAGTLAASAEQAMARRGHGSGGGDGGGDGGDGGGGGGGGGEGGGEGGGREGGERGSGKRPRLCIRAGEGASTRSAEPPHGRGRRRRVGGAS